MLKTFYTSLLCIVTTIFLHSSQNQPQTPFTRNVHGFKHIIDEKNNTQSFHFPHNVTVQFCRPTNNSFNVCVHHGRQRNPLMIHDGNKLHIPTKRIRRSIEEHTGPYQLKYGTQLFVKPQSDQDPDTSRNITRQPLFAVVVIHLGIIPPNREISRNCSLCVRYDSNPTLQPRVTFYNHTSIQGLLTYPAETLNYKLGNILLQWHRELTHEHTQTTATQEEKDCETIPLPPLPVGEITRTPSPAK